MAATPNSIPKGRLLVIDDEDGIRLILPRLLKPLGCDVLTAADGKEGLERVGEGGFEVVLCDIGLPYVGGIELLEAIKKKDPSTEVIMITGQAALETAIEALKKGAYDYVSKPFEEDEVLSIVSHALERRRLSRMVRELKELNEMKSDFLARVSHELRSPLTGILGFTDFLLQKGAGEVPQKQGEVVRRIQAHARDLLKQINNILDLAQLTAGGIPVRSEEFDLKEAVEEAARALEPVAKEKGLSLKLEVKSSLRIRGDRAKLQAILKQLLDNAIKFTREGNVFVSAGKEAGEGIYLSVRDTGIGIQSQDLPLIFDDFRQAESSLTRQHRGMGLGLTIAKKLAQILGGKITVEASPGKGSEFRFSLPPLS